MCALLTYTKDECARQAMSFNWWCGCRCTHIRHFHCHTHGIWAPLSIPFRILRRGYARRHVTRFPVYPIRAIESRSIIVFLGCNVKCLCVVFIDSIRTTYIFTHIFIVALLCGSLPLQHFLAPIRQYCCNAIGSKSEWKTRMRDKN